MNFFDIVDNLMDNISILRSESPRSSTNWEKRDGYESTLLSKGILGWFSLLNNIRK